MLMTKVEDVSKSATVLAFSLIGVGVTFMLTMIFLYITNIRQVQREMFDIATTAIQMENKVVAADSVINVQKDSIVQQKIEKYITVDSLKTVIDKYEHTILALRQQNKLLKSKLNEK